MEYIKTILTKKYSKIMLFGGLLFAFVILFAAFLLAVYSTPLSIERLTQYRYSQSLTVAGIAIMGESIIGAFYIAYYELRIEKNKGAD